ncbi:MAG: helix-turn-helix domain-containing protein [Mycobacterium sp.]
MENADTRLLVSHDEAMHMIGIGRTKLYELIDAREIEPVKIGRRALITTKSITAYVDRLSQAAVPALT